jgi:creatinine amidohydrolase/Fe(II)-dependent formamide hydrolase-like protein
VYGDPRRASAELGRIGVKQIVDSSVTALHALMQEQAGSKPSPQPLK